MRKLKKYKVSHMWNGHPACRINIVLPEVIVAQIEKESKNIFVGTYIRDTILEKYAPGVKWNQNPTDARTDCKLQILGKHENG